LRKRTRFALKIRERTLKDPVRYGNYKNNRGYVMPRSLGLTVSSLLYNSIMNYRMFFLRNITSLIMLTVSTGSSNYFVPRQSLHVSQQHDTRKILRERFYTRQCTRITFERT